MSTLLLFVITSIILIWLFFKNRYKYWEKRGVPTIPPEIPFGNASKKLPQGFSIGLLNKKFYDYARERNYKFAGVYLVTEPNLVVVDPELIKDVLLKDFPNFVDRGFYHNEKHDPISANLFTIDGQQWKGLRVKLTPTFTSIKMKSMFQMMLACSNYMVEYVEDRINEDLDIREITGKFTTDVIGACAFGFECNSFKYPDAEFRNMGKKIFYFDIWRKIRAMIIINVPSFAKKVGLTSNNKDVRDFFTKIVKDSMEMRKKDEVKRNDFLQLLLDLKDSMKYTLEEIVAQVFLFFSAGFETSSTAISFALYQIAENQELQDRLREEINSVIKRHDGDFTYEGLSEMVYLKKVLDETLRMWPSGLTINRRCTQDYKIPNTNVVIEKGTPLLISVYGIHMDPKYYPNPEKFDPDRFTEEEKNKRPNCTYLPFGDGPRNCIGQRFGLMQSRVAVARIVQNFKLRVSGNCKKIVIEPEKFLLASVDPIWLVGEKL